MNTSALIGLLIIILAVGICLEFINAYNTGWKKVNFSKWEDVFPRPAWGGVRLENDTWYDLKECEAELMEIQSDIEIQNGMSSILPYLTKTGVGVFNWLEKGEFVESANIGRGKEGFIILAYGVEEDEKKMVVPYPNWIYQIKTTKRTHKHPFDKGYIWIRISAKMKDEPLDPVIIRVRLEVESETLHIKEVKV